jgi:hypothetical protein
MRMAVAAALGVGLVLSVPGCGSSPEEPEVTATVPTITPTPPPSPSPSPSPADEDPYAIPDVIDEAYVDRILTTLNALSGDALRDILRHRTYTASADQIIWAVFVGAQREITIDTWGLAAADGDGLDDYAGGDLKTTTRNIVEARNDCIAVSVSNDRSLLLKDPPPVASGYVVLVPLDPDHDSNSLNPTPWAIAARFPADEVAPDEEHMLCDEALYYLR